MCISTSYAALNVHIGRGELDPSACKSLPVSLKSSQKSGLFFFMSNCYGHEIRKKTPLQPSNELISQWLLWELPALVLPQTPFQMQSPFSYIEFLFLLSLWFLIIKQADSNQFFYSVIPSYLPEVPPPASWAGKTLRKRQAEHVLYARRHSLF